MEPDIYDGSYCLFHEDPFGPHQNGKIVLAQRRSGFDCEDGGEFTVKRLKLESSRKRILLLPSNPDYSQIVVRDGDDVRILAVYVRTLEAA